jgi:hypothetical protein
VGSQTFQEKIQENGNFHRFLFTFTPLIVIFALTQKSCYMKKILYTLLSIVLLLIIASFYAAYTLVRTATVATDDNYGRNYDVAYSMVYGKYPEMQAWHDSLKANGLWRDTFLTNANGLRLHGIIIEHPQSDTLKADGAMMIIHGYMDDAPVMMRYAYCDYEMLHRNVLLPERQWCGLSEGDHITFGWNDRIDMHLWLDMAHNLWHEPIVVHGLSMGAATAMMLSGDDIADSLQVAGYVEDCGYSSTWEQLAYMMDQRYGLPAFPLLHEASLINKLWHGWWFSDGDAVGQVAKCRKPMLFIHGTDDTYVPFEMAHKVFNAKPEPKELWEVPGTKHARSIHDHWEEYVQRVGDFVNQCVEQ